MRVLITGSSGQLGYELLRSAPPGVELIAANRQMLDLTSDGIEQRVLGLAPSLIINAAAYTAVDRAETEPTLAHTVNVVAPGQLAKAAARLGVPLLHVSTDFVFDGQSPRAYDITAPTSPLGVYGQSKLAGEQVVMATPGIDACIVRTGWVYSAHGANFVKTMLRLMTERDSLGVVADQIGTPTWAHGLARMLWVLAGLQSRPALLHWSDLGVASWYDFAKAIQEEACTRGLLETSIPVRPIATSDYPTPARRPAFSVLDKSAALSLLGGRVQPVHWRDALRSMLDELAKQQEKS